ncbi:hypothetical protein DL96DRAFT_1555012 [Flagelloscypha sp. PMI_526]|nr:hypothetical protein DL96DRAFT_1555012 [Flagelloscypha sp. PMI_526]
MAALPLVNKQAVGALSAPLKAVHKFRSSEVRKLETFTVRSPRAKLQPIAQVPHIPNPFLPWKNLKTGCWIPPVYSLRQQADLVKKARAANALHLLPPGPKLLNPLRAAASQLAQLQGINVLRFSRRKRMKLQDQILRDGLPASVLNDPVMRPVVWSGHFSKNPKPGADLGVRLYAAKKKMFKGHRHERVAVRKAVYRKTLLRDMNRRMHVFKEYRRRRRPDPLEEPHTTGRAKMPF